MVKNTMVLRMGLNTTGEIENNIISFSVRSSWSFVIGNRQMGSWLLTEDGRMNLQQSEEESGFYTC